MFGHLGAKVLQELLLESRQLKPGDNVTALTTQLQEKTIQILSIPFNSYGCRTLRKVLSHAFLTLESAGRRENQTSIREYRLNNGWRCAGLLVDCAPAR